MKKLWNSVNWLIVAGIFTAGYLGIFLWWIGYDRIVRYPANNSLNEVGDFIAGFFSPLAFIWLVAAVLTQRQELTDTRDQFAKNQEVVDAQLTTINEQSVLLQQQHTLAEETAKKSYRLSLFEQRFAIYLELVALHRKMEVSITGDHFNVLEEIAAKASFIFGSRVTDYLEVVVAELLGLFTFEKNNGGAWTSSVPWKVEAEKNEKESIQQAILSERLRVAALLNKENLKEVMWEDMHVSDTD